MILRFLIILLNIYTNWKWYNTSVRQQKKHLYLRCCWSCFAAIYDKFSPSCEQLHHFFCQMHCEVNIVHWQHNIKRLSPWIHPCVCVELKPYSIQEGIVVNRKNLSQMKKKKKKLCVTRNPTHLKTPFTTCVSSCCLTFIGLLFQSVVILFVSVLITAVWFTSLSVSHDCSW